MVPALLVVLVLVSVQSIVAIYDPCMLLFALIDNCKSYTVIFSSSVNVFCGENNCYEVLGLARDASANDIKKV